MISIIYTIGLIFLLYFSYLDLKTSQIDNKAVVVMFICSLMISIYLKEFITMVALMAFMLILGYFLFYFQALGGADGKILASLPPFFGLSGFARNITGLWFFLIIFVVVGGLYALIARYMGIKKKIVFIPVILICYNLFWIFTLFWK